MLSIKKLLVSQPTPAVPERSPFFELAKTRSLAIDYTPFIRIEGVNIKEFRSQRVEILEHSAIIFTSRTTIDHFFRICEESRITVPETMKYLCHTEAIALYLQKYIVYRKRKISFADGTFKGLMELVLKHKDERFLLALSEPHKPEIPQTLEKLKVRFDPVVLARAVASDLSGVDIARYQMVVLYSVAEVKAFLDAFGSRGELPLIATFGDGTTRYAIDNGLKVNVMAPTAKAPSMARALEIYLADIAAGQTPEPVNVGSDRQAEEFVKTHQTKELRKKR